MPQVRKIFGSDLLPSGLFPNVFKIYRPELEGRVAAAVVTPGSCAVDESAAAEVVLLQTEEVLILI